jgi:glycosyltransferase 2 family protein
VTLRLTPALALKVGAAAAVAIVAGLLLWKHHPKAGSLADAFAQVQWEWVAAAIGWNLLSVVARSMSWRIVIEQATPPPRPALRHVFAAFSVGLFANAVLPGRIGELARVAVLRRRFGDRKGTSATLVGTVFAHRIFDLPPTLALIVYVFLAAEIPTWADLSLEAFVGVGLILLLVAFLVARRHQASEVAGLGPVRRLVRMARFGLGVMHEPFAAALAMTCQIVGWVCQLLAVYTAMRAFHIHSPLAAAALVLLLMNVATVFPLWPGNVGLVQIAVAAPLVQYGVSRTDGIAFGIGLQAIEASVGIGLGLLFLAREGFSYASLKAMPRIDEPSGSGSP